MATRWFVERNSGEFEDVGSERCDLDGSGALVFRHANGEVYIIAPGQWLTMTSEIEAD